MDKIIKLTKFKGETVSPYQAKISYLTEYNIDEILALHPVIRETLEHKEDFYFDDYNFYKYHLENKGMLLGCYVDDKLVAYGVMIVPGYIEENLGYDLNLPQDELPLVAHLDSFAVHPDYRGNGFQYRFSTIMEEAARNEGYKYLCSTVSPSNTSSLNNLLKLGLEVRMEKLKYGGKLRYILCKVLE